MEGHSGNGTGKLVLNVVLSILMAGNMLFIKRLVDEVDDTKKSVFQLHEAVTVVTIKLETHSKWCKSHGWP